MPTTEGATLVAFYFGYKTVRSVNSLDILDFRTWYPTKIHISTCDNHYQQSIITEFTVLDYPNTQPQFSGNQLN